jgi:allantoate deiminase
MSPVPDKATPAKITPTRTATGKISKTRTPVRPVTPEAATILDRCDDLGGVSASRNFLVRTYLSPEHARANRLVNGWMVRAGMKAWTDAAGNVVGRYEGAEPGAPALLLGSHLDTVPNAGRYDGPLGVMLAVSLVRRLHERGQRLPFAIEVFGFADEEGTRFGTALMGSRALAGTWDNHWWELEDDEGISMLEAFRDFGLDPTRVGEAARTPDQVVGYLEAHIEQGPYLEEKGRALGVVSSIAGARRFALTLTGRAGHAGGVPWDRRRDALCGASEAVLAIERLAKEGRCIATVGQLHAYPGAVNVIPGRVEFSLDLRAEFDHDRDRVWLAIQQEVLAVCERRRLSFTIDENHSAPAQVADPALREIIAAGIHTTGDSDPTVLFSKAGHDAMAVADLCAWAMLFVRCDGGISHHPDEAVTGADVAVALDAFEASVLELARQHA